MERKDEWLKIKYKGVVGWVRYLVPDVDVENISNTHGNINDYVPNKWFTKIEDTDDMHYCVGGCKYSMKQSMYNYIPTEIKECVFPICQNVCFMKAKDTIKYDTSDILKELLIVSCCHIEAFGACPSQDKFNKIINILATTIDVENFINPIKSLCGILSNNSQKIIYNPELGGKSHTKGITLIHADCDLVIDDVLIDIKCTRNKNDNLEILQLLGYASLLKYNERYNLRIKNVCILNLLQGKCKVYNIENILDSNLLEYLNLLTNKYNKTKQITIRDVDTTRMSHPLFMNELEAYLIYMNEYDIGKPDRILNNNVNFFKYINTTNLPLEHLQIYNKEYCQNANMYERENCFIHTLEMSGIDESSIKQVKSCFNMIDYVASGHSIKKTDIKLIPDVIGKNIRIFEYQKGAGNKVYKTDYFQTSISKKEKSILSKDDSNFLLGAVHENHYFLYEKNTKYSKFYINNYERIENAISTGALTIKSGKNKYDMVQLNGKYPSYSDKGKISTILLVKKLLDKNLFVKGDLSKFYRY